MKRNFQTLVVVQQLLVFAALAAQSATDGWLPPEMRGFLGAEESLLDGGQDADAGLDALGALWWGLRLAALVASVGVVLFRPWARALFTAVGVAGALLPSVSGLYVDIGLTVMLGALAGLAEGMIIALMYFSPLRKMFARAGGGEEE